MQPPHYGLTNVNAMFLTFYFAQGTLNIKLALGYYLDY